MADTSAGSGPGISSCTRYKVFLPKTLYLGKDAAFQTSIAVDLVLNDPEKQNSSADKTTTGDSDKSQGRARSSAASELSELVTVSLWGSHDENFTLEDKTKAQPDRRANSFRKVQIETVRSSKLTRRTSRTNMSVCMDCAAISEESCCAGSLQSLPHALSQRYGARVCVWPYFGWCTGTRTRSERLRGSADAGELLLRQSHCRAGRCLRWRRTGRRTFRSGESGRRPFHVGRGHRARERDIEERVNTSTDRLATSAQNIRGCCRHDAVDNRSSLGLMRQRVLRCANS